MESYKYIILGGGVAGLSFAHRLKQCGEKSFLVVEKETVPGGLCRSTEVDGAPLDIGGGHFLDMRLKEVLDFLFEFMPREEWDIYQRVSKIRLHGTEIDHPLESNLWQFPTEVQVDYLESIARAGSVRGEPSPTSFAEWIEWKFGVKIAREYMLPYNRKIWSIDLNELGTYWLYKLPNVSFRETLQSCLEGRPLGSLPAHGTFLYPMKHGYGEVWRRMGAALGDSLVTGCPVEHIDPKTLIVNCLWQAQTIISTIPWPLWPSCCELPADIVAAIALLKKASIDVDYHPETLDNPSHWIYEPDEGVAYHRLLLRSNFLPGARGYWTETNAKRSQQISCVRFHNEFAYPINTQGKPEAVEHILTWAGSQGIIGIGRWGRWEHMNSDAAVAEALRLAESMVAGSPT